MSTHLFTRNIKSLIKYLIFLFVLAAGQGGMNSAMAQFSDMPNPPNSDSLDFRNGVPPTDGQGPAQLHDVYNGGSATQGNPPSRSPDFDRNGAGGGGHPQGRAGERFPQSRSPGTGQGGSAIPPDMGQEYGLTNPETMQGIANEQPTLAPGTSPSHADAGLASADSQQWKSAPYPEHPIYDFLEAVKRSGGTERAEKETYLCEVLSNVTSPTHRHELIKAYWNLSEKMMKCHVRLAQQKRLQHAYDQMNTQANEAARTEIELAFQLVAQQYRALELEFIQAQYHFADLQSRYSSPSYSWRSNYAFDESDCETSSARPLSQFNSTQSEERPLPIPTDFPLAVPYDTKVKELEKVRSLSQKSRLLGHTIPLQYEAIVVRSTARTHADSQWQATLNYGQSPVSQIEALAREEMELIGAVIEYNRQVNDYVTETFGANISGKQLLASILVLRVPSPSSTPPNP